MRSVEKGDVFQEGKNEGEERVLFVSSPKSEFFLKRTVDTHRSARVVSGATREGSALGDTIADETERLAGHRCPRSSLRR